MYFCYQSIKSYVRVTTLSLNDWCSLLPSICDRRFPKQNVNDRVLKLYINKPFLMIRYDFVIVHNNLRKEEFSPLGEIDEIREMSSTTGTICCCLWFETRFLHRIFRGNGWYWCIKSYCWSHWTQSFCLKYPCHPMATRKEKWLVPKLTYII